MATSWKRVLTDSDLGGVGGSNLGNADLTQTSDQRVYNQGTNSSLQFQQKIYEGADPFPALELYNPDPGGAGIVPTSIYLSDTGGGGGVYVGYRTTPTVATPKRYRLPPSNTVVSGIKGKILAVENFNGSNQADTSFLTMENLFKPGGSTTLGLSYTHSQATNFTVSQANDSLIVYDDSESKFGIRKVEDVIGSIGANLATDDITQSDANRNYSLNQNTPTSSLAFKGSINGTNRTMLRVQCDGEGIDAADNYVFLRRARFGNGTITGAPGNSGYGLPNHSSTVGAGELLVSDDFSSGSGQLEFQTFGEYLDPDSGTGLADNDNLDQIDVDVIDDSMLVYHDGDNGLRHISVKDLRAPILYHFGNSSEAGGDITMRGVNGVQHDVTTNGVVAASFMNLVSISYSIKKVSGTGSAKIQIWKNGSLYMEAAGVITASDSSGDYVQNVKNFASLSGLSSPKLFDAGSWFAVKLVKSGTLTTDDHQITLRFV